MPYSKEQLKNNEYYERVVEAARREQISLYARQDLDSAASGSNTAANPNIRLKTGEFLSIPDAEELGSTQGTIVVKNEVKIPSENTDLFKNTQINELLNNNPVKTLSVDEFFVEYEKLRDEIPGEGQRDSHRYIYETSQTYIDTDDDEIKKLKERLQSEIDRLVVIQENLNAVLEAEAEEEAQDAAYAKYQADMILYGQTTVPYSRKEWDNRNQPIASETNGFPKLRFDKQPRGNHRGKTLDKTRVKSTYYGRIGRKKNKKVRKGNQYIVFEVKALGDPTLTYEWVDNETGASLQFSKHADKIRGIDTNKIEINMGTRYGPAPGDNYIRCKIKDASGEKLSEVVSFDSRHVNASS